MISTYTYKQPFLPDSLAFELAKESGRIYTEALRLNKAGRDFKEINKEMEKYCKKNCKFLHSQSAQASYQSLIQGLKSYFQAVKAFQKNPAKFSGPPKPPKRSKFMYKITFKKSAIRYRDGFLLLSVRKPYEPIRIRWATELPIPIWAILSYSRIDGWNINFVMDKECKVLALDSSKAMSIDLGVKRVATTFNIVNRETKTYSGKPLMSLVRLRNMVDARIRSKKTGYKRGSRKQKKIARAGRRIVRRIKHRQNDILHKYSRAIVRDAIDHSIGKIIIGDNSSTHNKTNTGKENQKIQQNPEQKLRKYIQYKFSVYGGVTEVPTEEYTSRDCPRCNHRKTSSPKGRIWVCESCGFVYDRDGIGSINIMKRNVSFDHLKWLDVVGGLTPPTGVKYIPGLSLVQGNLDKMNSVKEFVEFNNTIRPLRV